MISGMELLTRLPTFLVAVRLIAAVPGPAFALIVRRSSAIVLLYLGGRALLAARRGSTDWSPQATETTNTPRMPGTATARGGFATGATTNLANPKAAVFTVAVYPQFIPHGYPTLATTAGLGLLQISIETALYLGLAKALSRASRWFSSLRVRRTLDAVCGSVLVALGLRVATES